MNFKEIMNFKFYDFLNMKSGGYIIQEGLCHKKIVSITLSMTFRITDSRRILIVPVDIKCKSLTKHLSNGLKVLGNL